MPDLREQLQQCFQGRVCLVGLGNVERGDDGFGVRLAEVLKSQARTPNAERSPKSEARKDSDFGFRPSGAGFRGHVIVAGTAPEGFVGRIADAGFDHVIFLDAMDFGGAPGSVVLLDSDSMVARFPQVSTHKMSLGLIARQVETASRTKAWLLGVQPESLRLGQMLSPPVQATLELLVELLSRSSNLSPATSAAMAIPEVMA